MLKSPSGSTGSPKSKMYARASRDGERLNRERLDKDVLDARLGCHDDVNGSRTPRGEVGVGFGVPKHL